jgi:hypothetical protein
MQLSLKTVAAAVALALGSTSAMAVETPSAATGSSLFITVFDTVLGASVVQDLGLNYADFLESAVTPEDGLTLNFTVDLSVFGTVGSNPSNIRWTVFAGDSLGNAANTGVMVTAAPDLGAITGTNSDVTGMFGPNAAASLLNQWNNSCGAAAVTCTGTAFSNTYFGGVTWGDNFQYMDVAGSANLGTALGFYALGRSGSVASGPLTSLQYANASGVATWLLNADGSLSYTVPSVPLPAAVWLLLSALGGLGVVGRRKTPAA